MSSTTVRTDIVTFLEANSAENFLDLSGHYEELRYFLEDNGLTEQDQWVGLQFIGNDEIPATVGAGNTQGKYREIGAIYLHVVDIAKLGVQNSILTRAEALRDLLRGRRINDIVIESVSPPNFEIGATLQFEGGFTSASVILTYYFERDL